MILFLNGLTRPGLQKFATSLWSANARQRGPVRAADWEVANWKPTPVS